MRVLLLDNYDSFTWNVADVLARLGASVDVVRNDAMTVPALLARRADAVVVSPGPGAPDGAGTSVELVRAALEQQVPLLGICLGMQCLAHALGGRIVRLGSVVHGSASRILHDGHGIYSTMPEEGFEAGRYHSLVVEEASMPAQLVVTARTPDGVPMGVRHRTLCAEGVQFHPESILTPLGERLLGRFLELAAEQAGIEAPRPRAEEIA